MSRSCGTGTLLSNHRPPLSGGLLPPPPLSCPEIPGKGSVPRAPLQKVRPVPLEVILPHVQSCPLHPITRLHRVSLPRDPRPAPGTQAVCTGVSPTAWQTPPVSPASPGWPTIFCLGRNNGEDDDSHSGQCLCQGSARLGPRQGTHSVEKAAQSMGDSARATPREPAGPGPWRIRLSGRPGAPSQVK